MCSPETCSHMLRRLLSSSLIFCVVRISDEHFILPKIIVYILTAIKIEIKRLYIFFLQKVLTSGNTI